MLEFLLRNRLVGLFVGLVLAGGLAVLGTYAGLPFPHPVVLGVAVYVPIAALAGSDERFDLDAYLDTRSPSGVLVDSLLIVLTGLVVGALVSEFAIGAGADRFLLIAAAVAGTFLGGQVAFFARTRAFHRPSDGTD